SAGEKPAPAARTGRIHAPAADLGRRGGDDGRPAPPARGSSGETTPAEDADAPEAGAEEPKPKKKTRRGTRGGRNRRRKTGTAAATDSADGPVEGRDNGGEPVAAPEPAAPPEREPAAATVAESAGDYVPMSEWAEDFEG
ncbi:MAG: hypothetical protein OEW31_05440, partial [Thermoleophilia bacterium]|nr:hypothetical protein [Thermoleophilia bacterium]